MVILTSQLTRHVNVSAAAEINDTVCETFHHTPRMRVAVVILHAWTGTFTMRCRQKSILLHFAYLINRAQLNESACIKKRKRFLDLFVLNEKQINACE